MLARLRHFLLQLFIVKSRLHSFPELACTYASQKRDHLNRAMTFTIEALAIDFVAQAAVEGCVPPCRLDAELTKLARCETASALVQFCTGR